MTRTIDQEIDRMEQLIVRATEAAHRGEWDVAEMILKETLATAKRLPQRPIHLPDQSGEKQ